MSQFFTSRKLDELAQNGEFGAFIRIRTFVPSIKPKRRFFEVIFGERSPKVFPIPNSRVCIVYFQNSSKKADFLQNVMFFSEFEWKQSKTGET